MKRKIKAWQAAISLVFLLVAGGLCFFYFNIYRVKPAFSRITYEYGESVSRDIADYLVGTDWSVHLGELDLSRVDEAHMGTYRAVARHGNREFSYEIVIRDTLPPVIQWKQDQIYLAVNAFYTVDDVIEGLTDTDVHAAALFLRDGKRVEKISYKRTGEYTLELVAYDCTGNESIGSVSVIVDAPPVISGIRDFYVVPGSEPDYLADVTVWDKTDGELTECILVDDSDVELNEEGDYFLRYVAEDGYGLKTVKEAHVLVATPEAIQDLIGSRQIDYRRDTILGAPNIYDAGAASYEDIDEALAYMRPTLVQLYHSTGRGGYSSGSGYIMEITGDKIYICTNRHVVKKFEDWDIYFYDGTKVAGKALGYSEGYDVGVATVETADVPEKLLRQLMTVHIDKTYWDVLDEQAITLAMERVDREGGLVHVSEGTLVKTKQPFGWNERLDHTEVTIELVHGDSGSAVIDGYGNLICMAYAFSSEPIRYWCVPLDGILACYEEITGRRPYVY